MTNESEPKTFTVARKQVGDQGQAYFNTMGPMTQDEAEGWLAKPGANLLEQGFQVYSIRMDGRNLNVLE